MLNWAITHKAAYDFDDPSESTTLTLKAGDGIQVTEKGEHWWYGKNIRTAQEGYFPPKFVTEVSKKRGLKMPSVKASQPRLPRPSRSSESYKVRPNEGSGQGSRMKQGRALPNAPGEDNYDQTEGGEDSEMMGGGYQEQGGYEAAMDDPSRKHSLIKLKQSSDDLMPDGTGQTKTKPGQSLWESEAFEQPLLQENEREYSTLIDDFNKGGSVYRYSVMSHYMGLYACLIAVLIGASFFYYVDEPSSYIVTKILSLAASPILFIFEYYLGLSPVLDIWPQWAVVYFAISIPFFLRWQTILSGAGFALTGVFKILAYVHNEKAPKPRKKRKRKGCCEKSCKECGSGCCGCLRGAYWNLAALWLLFNAGIMAWQIEYWYWIWQHDKWDYSVWFVVAKVSGRLLDINGAFILVPMCRTLIRMAYNKALHNKCLSVFLNWFSLDTMLHMHILMAGIIFVMAIVHTFGHFSNYAIVGWKVYKEYGIQIWISGGALIIIIQLMYSASPAIIRRDKFEQFWYFHHLFIPFEILLFFHGKHYIGPHFWRWIIFPGIMYILERILRSRRANQPIGVVSVTHMENNQFKVLCLELEKTGPLKDFYEGQYVFIKCQTISEYQWHPFTISSAPQNDTVTLHIRNMGDNSWTGRLQNYLLALAPLAAKQKKNLNYYKITHIDENGNRRPQVVGPDNKPIIKIDGPMAAPTQHIREYDRVMIIGSGIGVTPVRASLESVIHHRFKYSIGNARPDHAHFYWVVSWKLVEGFLFMIRSIKEACDEWHDLTTKEPAMLYSKTFEFHVFVTSPPKQQAKSRKNPRRTLVLPKHHQQMKHANMDDERHIWGPSRHVEKKGTRFAGKHKIQKHTVNWSEWELYESLKDPPPKDKVRRWGPLIIHSGRPQWPKLFEDVGNQATSKEPDTKWSVGVCFCGNPMIGADLDKQCRKFTTGGNKFRIHKENF